MGVLPEMQMTNFAQLESIRSEIAAVRSKLSAFQREHKGWGERTECVEGALTCCISTLHGTVQELRAFSVQRKGGVHFSARGIGLDICPCCFVCGATLRRQGANLYLNNISGFVRSRADGEAVVAMFARGARLDFRESEPDWIQVKAGACDAHKPGLEYLVEATRDGGICKADIDQAAALNKATKETK